jgi:hypothetical protein
VSRRLDSRDSVTLLFSRNILFLLIKYVSRSKHEPTQPYMPRANIMRLRGLSGPQRILHRRHADPEAFRHEHRVQPRCGQPSSMVRRPTSIGHPSLDALLLGSFTEHDDGDLMLSSGGNPAEATEEPTTSH